MKKIYNCLLTIILLIIVVPVEGQEDNSVIKGRLTKKYGSAVFHQSRGWWTVWTGSGKNKKEGACDSKGNEIIPPLYDAVYMHDGYFEVKKEDKVAIRSLSNQELLEFKYNEVAWYQIKDYGYCTVSLEGKIGAVDKSGKEILPCKYDEINIFELKNGFCQVKINGKVGVVNKLGVEIVPIKYSFILYDEKSQMFNVSNGNVCGKTDSGINIYTGNWGVIRLDGTTVIPCEYENGYLSYSFYEGDYIRVNKGGKTLPNGKVSGGKWGIIDKAGKVIIPCEYEGVGQFSEDLCPVNRGGEFIADISYNGFECTGGKWGYVDRTNKIIIPIQYDDAKPFEDGAAMVARNNVTTLIQNPKKQKANIDNRIVGIVSDIDKDIPKCSVQNKNLFVFIYANERYNNQSCMAALNDGNIFKEYCVNTLGIPVRNINLYEDVTLGNLKSSINRMKDIADAYEGDVRFLVYYSGLGYTDEKTSLPYLLPIDVSITNLAMTGYNLYTFYSELENLSSKSIFVILDTSFNGILRDGKSIASSRGIAIKQKIKEPKGNMLVLTATSSNDENASLSVDGGHGMMTYFLLKKIKETNGDVTYHELSNFVISEVKRNSLLKGKLQVPQIHYPYNSNIFNSKIR